MSREREEREYRESIERHQQTRPGDLNQPQGGKDPSDPPSGARPDAEIAGEGQLQDDHSREAERVDSDSDGRRF